jgi:hypothetical protein
MLIDPDNSPSNPLIQTLRLQLPVLSPLYLSLLLYHCIPWWWSTLDLRARLDVPDEDIAGAGRDESVRLAGAFYRRAFVAIL